MPKKKLLIFLLKIVMIVSTETSCYEEVLNFTSVHPRKLSDYEILHVKDIVLPHFQRKCPYFLELDEYEFILYKELYNRSLTDKEL